MSYEVVLAEPHIEAKVASILEAVNCQLRTVILEELQEAQLSQELATATAVLAGGEYYTSKVLAAAPNLQIIARHGVGVDHVDLEAAAQRGIWVTNTPGATNHAVAEFTVRFNVEHVAAHYKDGVRNETRGFRAKARGRTWPTDGRRGRSGRDRQASHSSGSRVRSEDNRL